MADSCVTITACTLNPFSEQNAEFLYRECPSMYVACNMENLFHCSLFRDFVCVCDEREEWRKMKLLVIIER